jgi:tripartite-type tricarboxylate transporter receptor subunit TctC
MAISVGRVLLSFLLMLAATMSARADGVADFFKGRTIEIYIGFTAGGAYDAYARLLARYMGPYIPGSPTVVAQNMPGAGSLQLANYLYNVAPKDGTAIATFGRGMAMEPLIGAGGARFDASKFLWLGSVANEVSLCVVWNSSPVQNWGEATKKEFTVGGLGAGADPDIFAAVLKNVFGAKLRVVSGYPGGNDVSIAMERGEVDGRCGWSWSAIKATRSAYLAEKRMGLLIQLALAKSPELPDVPLVVDLAKDERQRQVLRMIFSRQVIAWPFAAPPGLPADRASALRDAFAATMKDAGFLGDARKAGLEVDPVPGAEMDRLIAELYRTPADIVAEARKAASPDGK